MDIMINIEEEDKKDGYITLICKGDFVDRRKTVENLVWDERVSMYFQKNTWVNLEVACALAKDFVHRMRIKHGDFWFLLYLNNLSAHFNTEVKYIYWEGKVFYVTYPLKPLNPLRL